MEALSKAYVYLCLGFTFFFFSSLLFSFPVAQCTHFMRIFKKIQNKIYLISFNFLRQRRRPDLRHKCRVFSKTIQLQTSVQSSPIAHFCLCRSKRSFFLLWDQWFIIWIYLINCEWNLLHIFDLFFPALKTNWEGAVTLRDERSSKLAHFRGKMTKNL